MLRAVATLVAVLALIIAPVVAKDPKPSRPLCKTTPLRIPFDQVNADKSTTVALGDDLGPSTLAAAYDGTVYIYYRDVQEVTTGSGKKAKTSITYGSWNLIQTLVSDNTLEKESFGSAMSISGNVIAIGQPQWYFRNAQQSDYTGAVYIYRRLAAGLNYTYEDTIYERDATNQVPAGAQFGADVSLIKNGSLLLVGAPGCCPFDYQGTAFTYTFGLPMWNSTEPEWYETIGPSQAQVNLLGKAVALSDTTPSFVLMGAPGYSGVAVNPGVYTAVISTASGNVDTNSRSVLPINALTITPPPDNAVAECGFAMSDVDEVRRRVVWTCPGFNNGRGATYTTDLLGSTWSTNRRIVSPSPDVLRFGQSVAYWDSVMVVTETSQGGGAVQVFQVVPVTLKPEAYLNTQTFRFSNTLPVDQLANVTIGVDYRGNVLAVGAYGELVIYECPLAPSSAVSAQALLVLVAALVALLLAR